MKKILFLLLLGLSGCCHTRSYYPDQSTELGHTEINGNLVLYGEVNLNGWEIWVEPIVVNGVTNLVLTAHH